MHEEDSVAEATLAPVDAQDNRTEACEIVKKEGNEHFKNGDYENALKSYENGERYLGMLFKGGDKQIASKYRITFQLNAAMTLLKLGKYNEATVKCEQVLESDPKNVKALYRRALCEMQRGMLDQAQVSLQQALAHDASNEAVLAKLEQVYQLKGEESQQQKRMFSGMFNKMELYPEKKQQQQQVAASYTGTFIIVIACCIVVLLVGVLLRK